MTPEEIKEVLDDHVKWLASEGGEQANFRGANLYGANLCGANLQSAKLWDTDFQGANLYVANLADTNLRNANLQEANLHGADLQNADLRAANIHRACFRCANLLGAKLPHFQIPNGEIIGWGRKNIIIVKLLITGERTACLTSRKCRCSEASVLEVHNEAKTVTVENRYGSTTYTVGETVKPDSYDDDIRVDCAHGIHFFLTREEAEEWK